MHKNFAFGQVIESVRTQEEDVKIEVQSDD